MSHKYISGIEADVLKKTSPCPYCGDRNSSDFYEVACDVGAFRLEYCKACRRVINTDSDLC